MALTKHKRNLLTRKEECRLEFAIEKIDVVYLVHQAWLDSFARRTSNKKAIADRGWNPLTYNCLLHPGILATKRQYNKRTSTTADPGPGQLQEQGTQIIEAQSREMELATAEKLNFSQGLASTLIGSILQVKLRQDARNGINQEENLDKQAQKALEAMETGKRVTAGRLAASGTFRLGPDVLRRAGLSKMRQNEIEARKFGRRN